MREFITYTIKDEMPPRMGQQIEVPEFMVSQPEEEIKGSIIPDIIRFAAICGTVYFGILTDTNLAAGLIGLTASLTAIALAGGKG